MGGALSLLVDVGLHLALHGLPRVLQVSLQLLHLPHLRLELLVLAVVSLFLFITAHGEKKAILLPNV